LFVKSFFFHLVSFVSLWSTINVLILGAIVLFDEKILKVDLLRKHLVLYSFVNNEDVLQMWDIDIQRDYSSSFLPKSKCNVLKAFIRITNLDEKNA